MNLIRKLSLPSLLMGVLFGLLLFALGSNIFSDNTNIVDESFEAKKMLGLNLFSRVVVGDVEMHKDTNVMHGPRYFYFQPNDVNHLVDLLRLKPCKKIPPLYDELVKRLQTEVKWPINWNTTKVYFVLFENPQSYDFAADMLLVDGNKVVLMIDGTPFNLESTHEDSCPL
jgi:hypothetical protein